MKTEIIMENKKVRCPWCNIMDVRGNMIKHKNMKFYHNNVCYQNYIFDETMQFINKKRRCPLHMTVEKFSEKHLESMLINNLNCIEDGMTFISKQFKVENGIIDILARDKNGVKCVIELKAVHDCKDIIFQCAYYPTQFDEKVRMIAICPYYSTKIKLALSNVSDVELKYYYFIGYEDNLVIQNYTY